jgi:hypothetical protein
MKDVMGSEEVEARCDRMSMHLKARCEGLLEVHDIMDRNWESIDKENENELIISGGIRTYWDGDDKIRKRLKFDEKVSYLHRTVKDYLKTNLIRKKLYRYTATIPNFDPHMSVLMSYVISLRRSVHTFYFDDLISHQDRVWRVIKDAFLVAQTADDTCDPVRVVVLQEFCKMSYYWSRQDAVTWDAPVLDPNVSTEWRSRFLAMAIHFGMSSYVEANLESGTKLLRGPGGLPLLNHALGLASIQSSIPKQPVFLSTVNVLLEHSAGVIEYCEDNFPWKYFWHLPFMNKRSQELQTEEGLRLWAELLTTMLQHNPGLEVTCEVPHCPLVVNSSHWELTPDTRYKRLCTRDHSIVAIIKDKLANRLPHEASILYSIIQERSGMTAGRTSKLASSISSQKRLKDSSSSSIRFDKNEGNTPKTSSYLFNLVAAAEVVDMETYVAFPSSVAKRLGLETSFADN